MRLTAWTTASGTINPTYDANGNLANDGVRAFTWDARGRLTAIAATPPSFVYDAVGRRTTATIAGAPTGYLYDGALRAAEFLRNNMGYIVPVFA